jgi:conjugative transposon TraN protein
MQRYKCFIYLSDLGGESLVFSAFNHGNHHRHNKKKCNYSGTLCDLYVKKIPQGFHKENFYCFVICKEICYLSSYEKIIHIENKNFGIQYLLKGIYSHNDLLFFYVRLKNTSTVSYDIDYVAFKIVDKKVAKRTAIQEQVITPLRSYSQMTSVAGKKEERTVFTLSKFTLPEDKRLITELVENDGGRNQTLTVENSDLVHAEVIDNLTVKVK